ncbi:hnh endonuclease [Caudoviricetes sp.]|nr:hnh endonuclease [Caudoviricetes sp.]
MQIVYGFGVKKERDIPTVKWTEGRIRSFITSTLRGGLRRWPPKWECLKEAKTGKRINEKSGRLAEHYLCASCKKEYTSKDIQVDHIDPVVCIDKGFISWDVFIKRLYCPKENLQVLCKNCHKEKTTKERKKRQ